MLQIKNTLGGGKPKGLYAWKKYSIGFKYKEASVNKYENISIDTPQSGSIKVYAGSSYTFDENTGMYTLVDPSEYSVKLNGASTTFAQIYVTYKSPTSANMWIHNSINYGFQVYNYTSSGVTLNRNSSDYPIMAYSAEAEPTYIFLDYIVSDKETAYPDGGEKDGYWYEKVSEGAKMSFGSIAVTGNPSELTIEHNLGVIPNKFAVFPYSCGMVSGDPTTLEYVYDSENKYFALMGYINGYFQTITDSEYAPTITETSFTGFSYVLYGSKKWQNGKYWWIALA